MAKKKLKINTKKLAILIVALVVIIAAIVLGIKCIISVCSGEKVYGNMSNLGLVATDGKTVYYNKYDKGIVKVKGNKEYQITNDSSEAIVVVKDIIYYLSVAETNQMTLKTVKTNGEDQKTLKLLNCSNSKLYYRDNYIYYAANGAYTGVYRINLETLNEEEVVSEYIQDFVLEDNIVYYTDLSNSLKSVDVETKEIKDISTDEKISKIQVVGKWIYYYDVNENALCKIKTNGKSKKTVATFVNNEIYNVTSKGIYYFNNIDLQICKSDLKGKKSKALVKLQNSITKINIANKNIYYIDLSKDKSQIYQMYRVKTNGNPANSIEY